MSDDPEDGLVT